MLQTNVKGPLTLAGIVVGLSLVLGLGGSWLLARFVADKSQAVADVRLASARAATLGPRIQALKEQEEAAAAYERIISLLMPTQEQLLGMPRAIEQLGRGHGVATSFQFLGSPAAGATKPGDALPFSLTATGDPVSLVAFLEDLEIKNPRYTLSVGNAELSLAGQTEGARLGISGSFYYQ